MTLVQSSSKTRSWLQGLRSRLPHFEYSEAKYYASFRSASDHTAFAYLNPAKRSIRLFLPLDSGDEPYLQPTPSTSSWAERFPSVFPIAGEGDLSTAARLIAKSYVGVNVNEEQIEIGNTGVLIDVESQDLTDDVIDVAIREGRLHIGRIPTNSAVGLTRQRRGQEQIRRLALLNYDSTCALCDVDDPSLLIASHIIGWAEAPEVRGLLSNVICLCRFHDVLFEQGYWSLSDDYTVLKKGQLNSHTIASLLENTLKFRKPHQHCPAASFLRQHRLRWGLETL